MDVGVGEPLHRILLLLQRRIEAEAVEHPRHDDVVGDSGLRQFAVAVDAELVDADGLVLERLVGPAVLGEQFLDLADGVGQLGLPVIIALVQPSPTRAARCNATSVWPPT